MPALLGRVKQPVMVVAPYLSERVRELLAQGGASYADATGNVRVVVSRPAVFIEGVGSSQDPERVPRPLHSLRGAAAGRVVRALVELELPKGVRELAAAASTPLGTVSRVVSFLEAEALVTRDQRKRVLAVDALALLSRWSKDYTLTKSNELHQVLEPRGLPALWRKLGGLPRYAATGSTAGPGIAPTRIAMLYVDDPEEAARSLDLVPAEAGANVWLLRPYDEVVFERTRQRTLLFEGDGRRRAVQDSEVDIVTVSAAQAIVDLLSSPGRGPEEAQALMETWGKGEQRGA
ncbi:MAG: hypothetical protein KF915_20290 [Polyangiaceae bacterium]|nr:hypothetical protein [Polyangiaceae bacterium]